MDKILEALKDWRFYIVFITFLIFIQIADFDNLKFVFDQIGGFIHA